MLVQKDEKEYVLKVALTENDNARLKEEAEALKKVRSEFVIAIYDTLEIAGRTVLVLQKAGEESLAIHLRKYGVPALDLLGRYGEHLLSAVASLERHGVVHRDIKPDNIGIHSINKQQNQLILYDFSLTSAPLDNLFIGTADYRDPFLKNRKSRPPKWDLAAERYSAGVTLYEMCVGDNQLPRWGKDESADPAVTKDELILDVEKFKSSVREGLTAFFKKALHRDPEKRYDNADEMRAAWQRVFTDAENRTVKTPGGEQVTTTVPLDQAELETLVAALDLSARARDALDGLNITTVKELLRFPTGDIHMMRGVGDQFRREIIGLVADLRDRFPDVPGKKTSVNEDDTLPSLERLHSRVVGNRTEKHEAEWTIRSGLLNVAAPAGTPTDVWPSQFDVADAMKVTRATVGQALAADQKRWGKDSLVSAFRNELFEQCQRLGGVATVAELIDFTLLLRPPTDTPDPERQRRFASAVARAAIETEGGVSRASRPDSAQWNEDGRRLHAGVGLLRRDARCDGGPSGDGRPAAATPPRLPRVVRCPAAAARAGVSGVQQRAFDQAGRCDEQQRGRFFPAGALPTRHARRACAAAGDRRSQWSGPRQHGRGLQDRRGAGPREEPLPRSRAAPRRSENVGKHAPARWHRRAVDALRRRFPSPRCEGSEHLRLSRRGSQDHRDFHAAHRLLVARDGAGPSRRESATARLQCGRLPRADRAARAA